MQLIWIDLETTGLDPRNDCPLEIGMMISQNGQLLEPEYSQVITPRWDLEGMSDFVLNMHMNSGLLKDVENYGASIGLTESEAIGWLDRMAFAGPYTMAGSSVHFDRAFLQVHMPRLAKLFSHRLFDVSAIKLFCQSLGMPELPKANAHRAIDDIKESFGHYEQCRKWLGH